MDTTKVIATLLVLTIILSIATIALNAFGNNGATVKLDKSKGADTATVKLYVEGGMPVTEKSNVGLYVEETPITP